MKELWFHARRYGWGWTPATIEGWAVIAAFVIAVIVNTLVLFYRVRNSVDARQAIVTFLIWLAIAVAALFVVAWITGEPPRWRWDK